ncbi:hypothetical protein OAS86_04350 [Gammaproteobacteria bacterium]|nr:hypothetical protein [Gammaproteobacteria bacterium]
MQDTMYFIPLTDDMLYEHPELIAGPVVPYGERSEDKASDHQCGRLTEFPDIAA